jgi:hypothetical protein
MKVSDRVLNKWQTSISRSGQVAIKLGVLLRAFGYARRGPRVIATICEQLRLQSPPIFIDGFDMSGSLEQCVTLSGVEILRNGTIWMEDGARGSERRFKERYDKQLLRGLSLEIIEREYSPDGTRDSADFLCEDKKGNPVLVEFKVDGGERRSVEQLLRYIYQVSTEGKYADFDDPHGVLITHQADLATRAAMATLDQFGLLEWHLYGFDHNGKLNPLIPVEHIPRRGDPRKNRKSCAVCGSPTR